MSEYDIVNKSWDEQSIMYKQKGLKQLKKYLKGMHYLNVRTSLYYMCIECIRNDDALCLGSVLSYFAKRTMGSEASLVNGYGLWYLSMKQSKKCFEYLVSVSKNINERIPTIRLTHTDEVVIFSKERTCIETSNLFRPGDSCTYYSVLNIACINGNEHAVSVLLKNGADVNNKEPQKGYNAFHHSMLMRKYHKYNEYRQYGPTMPITKSNNKITQTRSMQSLDKIMQMLLLSGVDTATNDNCSLMVCDGRTVMFSLSCVINETVGSFTENCY